MKSLCRAIIYFIFINLVSHSAMAITNGKTNNYLYNFSWLVKVDTCAGVIINKRYILTAAHCIDDKPPSLITLRGAKKGPIKNLARIGKAKRVITHEDYRSWKESEVKLNDIALIELKEDLVFSSALSKVKLPAAFTNNEYINQNSHLILGGYGRLANNDYAKELHYLTDLELIPDSYSIFWDKVRNRSLLYSDHPELNFVSTYFTNQYIGVRVYDGQSACRGDSGAPLVDANTNTVYGLVSHGQEDCSNQPAFFLTKVSHYLDWINEHVGQNEK